MDRVVLGDIPLFTRERKIIFVKNNSSEHRISFTWHVTNPDHIRVKKKKKHFSICLNAILIVLFLLQSIYAYSRQEARSRLTKINSAK
jgi:hypothetical protein